MMDNQSPATTVPNEHLRLASYWVSTVVAKAQDTQLAQMHAQLASANTTLTLQTQTATELESQLAESTKQLTQERQALSHGILQTCGQLDQVNKLLEAIEQNVSQMETALSKAESAVGLTLAGRLEQFARQFHPSSLGVPYLRQWAATKSEAVPKVLKVDEYIS
ncbi:hypothetical protein EV174_005790 [Coemansia sp. RSA 2320]|nr:hypothetical protein EV174_005790 [Coemansia sp. RSA 2320]